MSQGRHEVVGEPGGELVHCERGIDGMAHDEVEPIEADALCHSWTCCEGEDETGQQHEQHEREHRPVYGPPPFG